MSLLKAGTVAAIVALGSAASPATAQDVTMERVPVVVLPAGAQVEAKAGSPEKPGRTLRIISDFDSPCFSFRDGMKNVGFEVDLGEALGKEMGAAIEWSQMAFNVNAYASALDKGSADAAISSISINPERREMLAFTKPYFLTSLAIAAKKGVDWDHQWFTTGLQGWTVGVMRGTTGERWARENLAAEVKTYSGVDRLANALKDSTMPSKNGKSGFCIMHDQAILVWALADYAYHYEIVERNIVRENYGIAVSKNNPKLLAELNVALEKLRGNGVYKKIYQKWYHEAQDLPLFDE